MKILKNYFKINIFWQETKIQAALLDNLLNIHTRKKKNETSKEYLFTDEKALF